MSNCIKCGQVSTTNAKFCQHCGQKAVIYEDKVHVMSDHEFDDFINGLSRGLMREQDQFRKVKAAVNSYLFTCQQVVQTIQHCKAWQVKCVELMYKKITNKDKFIEIIIPIFKFQDEKDILITYHNNFHD